MRRFLKKLRSVRPADLASFFVMLAALPYAAVLRHRRPHIWLICEERLEARDNGYWLYRYICREHPQIDVVYAIDFRSPDYKRVASLGRQVIPWGGITHWTYYLAAENNISSQKGGKPNAALCYFLEVYGIRKNRRVFLQHGITMNDTVFLHYENSKMSLFVCGTGRERNYICEGFGYPEDRVRCLGLARWDGLHGLQSDRNLILVMPSWRRFISNRLKRVSGRKCADMFRQTSYYRAWQSLLASPELADFLEENDLRLVFYPHRNMQRFLPLFQKASGRIEIADWHTHDVQDLLRRSAFLVTDYSSVSMDFAYMGKPLLYYQFDSAEFRQKQYAEGYFDYSKDGFGPVCVGQRQVMRELAHSAEHGFARAEPYSSRARSFFTLHDCDNCKRIYEAICELDAKEGRRDEHY